MRKSKRAKKILASIMASVMLLFAVSTSVYAATNISYAGTGSHSLVGTGKDEIKASLQEQKNILTSCGLNATVSNENVTLSTDSADFSSFSASNIKKYHENLIKNGILSFLVYDHSVCSLKVDSASSSSLNLVVCLDFSSYNIVSFESDFLEGIAYALMGTSLQIPFLGGNNTMTNDTEETYAHNATGEAIHPVQYIDAALGREIDKTVKLHFRGMAANDNNTTYMTIDGGSNIYIHAYSLHIVLPRNNWGGNRATISFKQNSLTVDGVGGLSVDPPQCIGLDVSGIVLDETGENDYVSMHGSAAPDTSHFHYVGTDSQMEYCMTRAFDNVLTSAQTASNYVEEIFVKPYTNSHFTRGYAGIGKEDGKLYASVYDQPPASAELMEDTRAIGILIFYYWLRFGYTLPSGHSVDFTDGSYIGYRHYRRDAETYLIEAELGVMTCDFTFNNADSVDKWINVYCTHTPTGVGTTNNLIGSFRRVISGADGSGNPLYSVQFKRADGTVFANE